MMLKDLVDINKPFVIYKKPHSGKLNIWQQKDGQLYTSNDLSQSGYYFAPYDFTKHPVVVFPTHQSVKQDILIREIINGGNTTLVRISEPEIEKFEAKAYQDKVAKAVQLIKNGKLQKIVLSRTFKVFSTGFDKFESLLKLMTVYEQSYVYLWHHPKVGTWMGVTPELLAQYQTGIFQTMALAGTLAYDSKTPVTWQPKEIKEQQFVTDYIVDKLQKFSSNIKVTKPTTVYQGHLAHIRTDISAEINSENLSDVILDLHPTPAVCGLPVEKAKSYIAEIENRDRNYYSGFLGEKNKDFAALYVNLRSMEILSDYLILHVGGGIVGDSIPKQEWQEILIKSKILLSVSV